MCRLLAYTSLHNHGINDVIGSHFDEYVELSSIHKDGWGIATSDGAITLDTATAKDSDKLRETVAGTSTDGALFHLRWASPGIPVDVSNNHPFKYGDYSFIHNGSLHPYDSLDSVLISPYKDEITSASDSHRYFMYLMQNIEKSDLRTGILETVAGIKKVATYASLNAMLLSPEYLVMINEHDVNNRPSIVDEYYYDIRYKADGESVAIASSGWNQDGWTMLPNHTIMIVNRKDLTVNFLDLL